MLDMISATALNHLLAQNSWALARLARFSGKTVRFDIAPLSIAFTILPDGTVVHSGESIPADAQCVIAPSLLPRLALHDELAYKDIESTGDTSLLSEIFFLFRNLRWDVAEDLSHVTGDIAAERIVQTMDIKQQQLGASIANLAGAFAEYFTEENPLLAKPSQINSFMQEVDTLRDDIARLEQRVARLARTGQ
jgi:ubiquinone biosynthesis accessory factor UbiJ